MQVRQNGRNWQQLTAPEIAALENLADETGRVASIQAHNILRFATNHLYEMPTHLPEGTLQIYRTSYNPQQILALIGTDLKAFPNPAKDFVTFEYVLVEIMENAQLIITDATGKPIQQFTISDKQGQIVWDTREMAQGVYFYALKKEGETLKSGQIVVVK